MKERSAIVCVAVAALLATGGLMSLEPARPAASMTAGAKMRATAPLAVPLRICGSGHFTDRETDLIDLFVKDETRRQGRGVAAPATFIGTIQVAFHVIYVDQGFGFTFGLLTQADVDNQIAALNAAYDNVDFVLAGTTFTNNQDWFFGMTPGSQAELQAKTALHWDNTQFLNIYTCAGGGGLLGYATFPWELRRNPVNDGVVVAFDTLPGGSFPFDEGDTVVHEVGHWCGLFHTFQGACSLRNDRVADTPAEQTSNFGCPAFRDTCPASGSDPITNFMDYSDDVCLIEFSEGQYTRMNQMLQLFRPLAIGP